MKAVYTRPMLGRGIVTVLACSLVFSAGAAAQIEQAGSGQPGRR